jgi:hypothetical protein
MGEHAGIIQKQRENREQSDSPCTTAVVLQLFSLHKDA